MNEVTKQALLSVVRSSLMILGSLLVAHGYASKELVNEVVGALMAGIPAAWGVWDKYQAERKTAAREVVAVNAGVALSNSTPAIVPPVHPTDVPAVIQEFSTPKE